MVAAYVVVDTIDAPLEVCEVAFNCICSDAETLLIAHIHQTYGLLRNAVSGQYSCFAGRQYR